MEMTDWTAVLRAFTGLGLKVYRYPEDIVRGGLPVAYELARDGLLHRNPATGYFAITEAGLDLAVTMGFAR